MWADICFCARKNQNDRIKNFVCDEFTVNAQTTWSIFPVSHSFYWLFTKRRGFSTISITYKMMNVLRWVIDQNPLLFRFFQTNTFQLKLLLLFLTLTWNGSGLNFLRLVLPHSLVRKGSFVFRRPTFDRFICSFLNALRSPVLLKIFKKWTHLNWNHLNVSTTEHFVLWCRRKGMKKNENVSDFIISVDVADFKGVGKEIKTFCHTVFDWKTCLIK